MCIDNCGGVTVFKGENGVGIVSTVDNGDGTFTITYTDGTTFTTSDLTGPTGATGATGPAGTIPGGGENNYVARWTPDGVTLGKSLIQDDGANLGIGGLSVNTKFNVLSDKPFGLSVQQSVNGIAGQYYSSTAGAGANVGLQGNASGSTTSNIGIQSNVTGTGTDAARGLKVVVSGGSTSYIGEFKDGSEVTGHVLTCVNGATGAATWQTPASGGGMTWNLLTGALGATTLAANNGYLMRDVSGAGPKQLTLPSSGVAVGDKIEILATDEGGAGTLVDWDLLEGNVNDVIFYTYWVPDPGLHGQYMTVSGNKSSSPLLTFTNEGTTVYDTRKRNAHFTLTCVADLSPGYTWQINALDGQVIN